jgi:tRNA wybutosine-synthesizing protein 1
MTEVSGELRRILERQGYRVVGAHSGVKLCHWLGQKLLHGRACYKEKFYGIESHRCLQMTPTVNHCNQACLFCWRFQGMTKGSLDQHDEPAEVLDGCIAAQRKLITGFRGDPRCAPAAWMEASEPNQVAISLAGEPTMYEGLGGLIAECNLRGMTTFLVTNGTNPGALERLDPLPTQLYVTVAAPNEEMYKRLCAPTTRTGWRDLRRTLELLPSLGTRRVVRHTLVQGHNLGWEAEYARLDSLAEPDFVEPKGYVFVGYSRERMRSENMPSMDAIRAFSGRLSAELGYEILGESPSSRVAVLGRKGRPLRLQGVA